MILLKFILDFSKKKCFVNIGYIGKGSSASKPRAVSNDDFVLVDIPKYAGEWPQLCQVINVAGDQFTVHWYRGSRTTAWTPCKRRIQGTRGKQEA